MGTILDRGHSRVQSHGSPTPDFHQGCGEQLALRAQDLALVEQAHQGGGPGHLTLELCQQLVGSCLVGLLVARLEGGSEHCQVAQGGVGLQGARGGGGSELCS